MLTLVENIDLIEDITKYDVILVGTNTYHAMGNGFQKKVRVNYPNTYKLNTSTKYGDINKLGTRVTTSDSSPIFSLCFITHGYNFRPDINPDYLDYEALEKCVKTANIEFSGLKVATTFIGCSKFDGNGDKEKVLDILNNNSNNINLYVYDYNQLETNVEHVIRYLNVVKNESYDKEKKTELILEMIESDSKLETLDNSIKRMKRIKSDVKALLNKK